MNSKPLSYYLDNCSLSRIVSSPERDKIVSLLRDLREGGKVVTYMSAWTITELLATFEKNPELARQLAITIRDIARMRFIRETKDILCDELWNLEDKSHDVPLLLFGTEPLTLMAKAALADAASEKPPARLMGLVKYSAADAVRRKEEDKTRSEGFVRKMKQYEGADNWKFQDIHDFFDFCFKRTTHGSSVAKACMPFRGVRLTKDEFAKRLDETRSYRALVYLELSQIFYKAYSGRKRFQKHWGDIIDAQHIMYAAHFDIFVSDDENCRDYAAKGAEGRHRIMPLDAFVALAKGL